MAVVPWHLERSFLASGWCRGDNYSAVLPDLPRVAAAGRAEAMRLISARGGDASSPVASSSSSGVAPVSRPRSAAPTRSAAMTLPAHDAARSPGPAPLWLQRPRQDSKMPEGGIRQSAYADEGQLLEATAAVAGGLERLRLGDNRPLTPEAMIAAASRTPRLKELCLRGTCATDEVISAFVASCPELCVLDVSDCESLRDLSQVSTLTELRELRAPRCTKAVTPEFVGSLRSCRKLEALDLSFCPGVTGHSLQELAVGCRALVWLSLAGCLQLNDVGLVTLLQANPGIKHLRLAVNTDNLSDDAVAGALRWMRRLRVLDCAGCPQLSLKTPQSLARNCEWLDDLSLASCVGLQDEELKQLLTGCPRLERLDLTGCQALTEQGLLDAVPAAPSLTKLCVSLLPDLSEQGLSLLRSLCPSCTIERHARACADPNELTLYIGKPVPPPKVKKAATRRSKSEKKSKKKR
mmetsp:Transcript_15682/g.39870  ORF Transcript_15682/g.39870 Transcript_15682/m.39870 type:complete len:465 (+) Transcript_15682:59-1453(+)|eukprot:CAMPEP_0115171552 /NCGR_PEP_ID=MMETSP0270-20121206/2361_1 /TAXON_ID=71861 /ORGANISM="Scrippsiella trochoidea, Strain CCMP3099" /LENGTH=464 /DNA_ID=CAMNT_0002584321 /DNA_START=20 /DNA_END=1414 /DNA_ORIENTATION=+